MAQMSDEELLAEYRRIDPWSGDNLERWDALAAEMARRDLEVR